MRALKEVFRRHRSQPIERVIALINPVLRGWVNYFAVGHSSACFSFIKDWVEKKVRCHLAHAEKRKGFDWERAESRPSRIGPISFDMKANGGAQCGKSARCVRRGGAGDAAWWR